mmetsp:Transcript_2003/g.2099  ORF Transcript_2003/g.2099 Transcript_2003/m.2099 type:complete len:127 (-) Transcript_2003:163-543(-)
MDRHQFEIGQLKVDYYASLVKQNKETRSETEEDFLKHVDNAQGMPTRVSYVALVGWLFSWTKPVRKRMTNDIALSGLRVGLAGAFFISYGYGYNRFLKLSHPAFDQYIQNNHPQFKQSDETLTSES